MTKSNFLKKDLIQSAIIRKIEIIGEAVKNLPKEIIVKYPDIEWNKIAGTRDKLIHNYFGVDLDLIWKSVKTDIPKLKKQIIEIKKEMKK